jgi:hypothetical protein
MSQAVTHNPLGFVFHAAKRSYTWRRSRISGVSFLPAAAAGFHGMGAMTAQGAILRLCVLGRQGQGEVEYEQKSEQDE